MLLGASSSSQARSTLIVKGMDGETLKRRGISATHRLYTLWQLVFKNAAPSSEGPEASHEIMPTMLRMCAKL